MPGRWSRPLLDAFFAAKEGLRRIPRPRSLQRRYWLAQLAVERKSIGELVHLATDFFQGAWIFPLVQRIRDPGAYLQHLFFLHAAGREGRRPDANPARFQRRIGV